MSANIFDKRFLSVREPAWHKLGLVVDEGVSAVDALEMIGDYTVTLEPVSIPSVGIEVPGQHAIVRHPVADDPEYRVFGQVSGQYTLITPSEMAAIWDDATKAKIETIGALKKGEELFISTKLPTFKVKDDEVDSYLLAVNPMTGRGSAQVRVAPVRVVCTNTLALAKSQSTETYLIPHNTQARARMTHWLSDAYLRSTARVQSIASMFVLMASVRATPAIVQAVAHAAYPDPTRSNRMLTPDMTAKREYAYTVAKEWAVASRGKVVELFNGAGTGMESEAAAGTIWGLYNSVTELENYRRMRGVQSSSYDVVFGDRADTMTRAFEMAWVGVERGDDVPVPFSLAFSDN